MIEISGPCGTCLKLVVGFSREFAINMDIGNLDNVFGNKPTTTTISNSNNAKDVNTDVPRTVGKDEKNISGQGISLEDMMAQVGDYDDKNATPAGQVNQDDDDDSDDDQQEEKEAPISKPDGLTAAAAEAAVDAGVKKSATTTTAPITPSSN
ncbi:unnamed protein product [Absidia cylindrospora]